MASGQGVSKDDINLVDRNFQEQCAFCDIVQYKKEEVLREEGEVMVVKDISPHAQHHYLVISKTHIDRPTDLTSKHVDLVRSMELIGKDFLADRLKELGEADIMETRLRIGFHWPPLISVNHLHMHVLYPIDSMYFFFRTVLFRPGKFFKLASTVMQELKDTECAEETGSSKI